MGEAKRRKLLDPNYGKIITYSGVKFANKLHAQWACFFDLVGCKLWDYQPKLERGTYDDWEPDFQLSLGYEENGEEILTLDFFVLITDKDIGDFPLAEATKIMNAHPYNHPLISGNQLVGEDIGMPNEDLTECILDRVIILGNSPFGHSNYPYYKTNFARAKDSLKSVIVELKPFEKEEKVCVSGWLSTAFFNDGRIWKHLDFEGQGFQDEEKWLEAQVKITKG